MSAPNLAVETMDTMPEGKRRLIEAALRLAARNGGFSSIGVRELGREADLNPNTFYRHFSDMEDLARATAEEVARHLMAGMRQVRIEAARHADATEGAAQYFLEEVAKNPDAYRVGLSELHGGPPNMRRILAGLMEEIADLSVEQIKELDLVPGLGRSELYDAALSISYYMLYRAGDFLDAPEQAEQIRQDIVHFIRIQFLGALALQDMRRERS